MTYPIDVSIPAANHTLAQDQAPIQTNFSNINQYVQVDHINPAASGAGEHKQVTFNSNNVPGSFPVTPPILFTNNQDGAANPLPGSLSQLFFYTGAALASQDQFVSLVTGSVLLLGGIILKWGPGVANSGAGVVNTFATAFPNNCFAVIATSTNSALSSALAVGSFTTSGFTCFRTGGSGAVGMNYIALGN
jgi:hypothetical protein